MLNYRSSHAPAAGFIRHRQAHGRIPFTNAQTLFSLLTQTNHDPGGPKTPEARNPVCYSQVHISSRQREPFSFKEQTPCHQQPRYSPIEATHSSPPDPGPKQAKQPHPRNALKHGLTGNQIVIPGEDPAAYDELRASIYEQFDPQNDVERTLVEELAANSWRLARAHRVETAFYRKLTEKSSDPDMTIAMAMFEKPAELNRLHRYVTSIERAYYRAMDQLNKLKHARRKTEQDRARMESYREGLKAKSGFVSQPELEHPSHQPVQQPSHARAA